MDNFENRLKKQLDDSLETVPVDIARRLQQARYAALEKSGKPIFSFRFPKTMVAAFAIAALSISLFVKQQNTVPGTDIETAADLEMLTSTESLELLEDMEFMQWLAESEEYAS